MAWEGFTRSRVIKKALVKHLLVETGALYRQTAVMQHKLDTTLSLQARKCGFYRHKSETYIKNVMTMNMKILSQLAIKHPERF